MSASSFPVELWLQILRLATISPLTHRLRATTYRPFETLPIGVHDDASAATKSALVLVCKQWRRIVTEFLYEDVRLQDAEAFYWALEHDQTRDYGRWVQRACLPYISSATPTSHPITALRILEQCPALEILVRVRLPRTLEQVRFEFPATCPSLPSVKRLDWWHDNEASNTGGINSLADVLSAAPNTQYLTIGGDVWLSFLQGSLVTLPSLTTLRLLRMNVLFVRQISRWSLPSLTHVIIDTVTNFGMLQIFWEAFGPQLQTVELGISLKFYIYDALSFILAGCPNLEELNYYVNFTKACRLPQSYGSLTTIGLHAHPTSFFSVGGTSYWEHLESHFALFSPSTFPALNRVVLYGDWSTIVEDERFFSLVQSLHDRRCTIEEARIYL